LRVFISGSMSIKTLPVQALYKIDDFLSDNFTILIGDAPGTDTLVQKYLFLQDYRDVLIYFVGNKIRNNVGQWETKQIKSNHLEVGRALYTLKDVEMVNDTDIGLMVWDGKSKGTLNNTLMMKSRNKEFSVIMK